MILKKEFNILKKPYLAPRIEFEEIEADEREMLMASTTSGTAGGFDPADPENNDQDPESLTADFVMNDVNSDF